MLRCIHCDVLGIGITAKRWSGRETPAKCAKCGGLSHVIASTRSGIPVATLIIILAFAVLGAVNGNLLVGVWRNSLIARLGPEACEKALAEDSVRPFDITGKPMKNWVLVEPDGIESDEQLGGWIERAMEFVKGLPGK